MWADWWGFKMEAFDGIRENIALVDAAAGGCAIVHSDSAEGIQRLNQEAAKAMARRPTARASRSAASEAIRWITLNPAQGDRDRPSRPARSSRARWPTSCSGAATRSASTAEAEQVYIDGALVFDRDEPGAPAARPTSSSALRSRGRCAMSARVRARARSLLALAAAPGRAGARRVAITGGTVHTVGPQGTIEGRHGGDRATARSPPSARDVAVPAGARRSTPAARW